jgi:hypothetical protein
VNCVAPTFAFTSLPANNTLCNNVGPFVYKISTPVYGCNGSNMSKYTIWYRSLDGVNFTQITSNSAYEASHPNQVQPETDIAYVYNAVPGYYIKAVVNQTCTSGDANFPGEVVFSTSAVQYITVTTCTGN